MAGGPCREWWELLGDSERIHTGVGNRKRSAVQETQQRNRRRRRNKDGEKTGKTMAVFSHAHPRCLSEDCVKLCLSLDVVIYRMDVASATVCSYMFNENTAWTSINLKCFLRKTLLVYCSCNTYMMLL